MFAKNCFPEMLYLIPWRVFVGACFTAAVAPVVTSPDDVIRSTPRDWLAGECGAHLVSRARSSRTPCPGTRFFRGQSKAPGWRLGNACRA